MPHDGIKKKHTVERPGQGATCIHHLRRLTFPCGEDIQKSSLLTIPKSIRLYYVLLPFVHTALQKFLFPSHGHLRPFANSSCPPPHPQPLVITATLTTTSMASDSTHGIMKHLTYFTDHNDIRFAYTQACKYVEGKLRGLRS